MSTLLRAQDITKTPVVTFAGEDVAQIKDVVYAPGGGEIAGFTLAGRGIFSGPTKTILPWPAVVGLGPDAVIIRGEEDLVPRDAFFDGLGDTGPAGNVLGSQVLTDDGSALGVVHDVIVGISAVQGGQADVVGYEIDPAESLGRGKQRLLIPLPDTLAASGQHLMVPAAARNYLADDLNSFGQAVDAFRSQIGDPAAAPPAPPVPTVTPGSPGGAPDAPGDRWEEKR
ncbi:PRC-barrel domain containing protein [Nakamurella sp. YIM 132087]|uniref:PRC-barrel domain containing protein n=1 Tax=Nakamurella alba TaxID=2665158 RepID=A0A7K1FL40_9ACTN|nr:PRC-barrel domain-containing protein [Nakamurella alba]MTD14867.1 PRC-barrel domain containing protein [Nakamurella alba]